MVFYHQEHQLYMLIIGCVQYVLFMLITLRIYNPVSIIQLPTMFNNHNVCNELL